MLGLGNFQIKADLIAGLDNVHLNEADFIAALIAWRHLVVVEDILVQIRLTDIIALAGNRIDVTLIDEYSQTLAHCHPADVKFLAEKVL